MFPTNSECLISISDAFSAFVYGYPSSCPRAQCTPNKSVTTLRYTRRHGPVYTGHACRHLPSAVAWISEDRLLKFGFVVFVFSPEKLVLKSGALWPSGKAGITQQSFIHFMHALLVGWL